MDDLEYDLFDLKISGSRDAGFEVDLLHSEVGEHVRVAFTLPFTDDQIDNFILRMEKQATGKRAGPALADRQKVIAREFGNSLFHSLFTETDLEQLLKRSLDRAQGAGRGVMLRLRLGEADALAAVPWEYMHGDPDDGFFALSTSMPIVRYLEVPGVKMPVTVEPPIRVLVVISSPHSGGYERLEADAEWHELQRSTSELRAANRIILERLDVATLSALASRLEKRDVHVLHFIGHGEFHDDVGGTLILEEDDGSARAVPGDELLVALKDAGLRLVLLNSCESARTRPDQTFSKRRARTNSAFSGVAQQLVRGGAPAVVAMQFEISDTAAIAFAKYFYQALNDGESIDRSVSVARKGLFTSGNFLEWATPVIYTRSVNNRLLAPIDQPLLLPTDQPTDAAIAASPEPEVDDVATTRSGSSESAASEPELAPPVDDQRDLASIVARGLGMAGYEHLQVEADELEVRVSGDMGLPTEQKNVENLVKNSLVGFGQGRIISLHPSTPRPAAAAGPPAYGTPPPQHAKRGGRRSVAILVVTGVLMLLAVLWLALIFAPGGSDDGDTTIVRPTAEPVDAPTVEPRPDEATVSAIQDRLEQLGLSDAQVTTTDDVEATVPELTTTGEGTVVVVTVDAESPADVANLVKEARDASRGAGGEDVVVDVIVPIGDIGVMRIIVDDDEAIANVLVDSADNADRASEVAQGVLDDLVVESPQFNVLLVDEAVRSELERRAPYATAFDDLVVGFDGLFITIDGYIDHADHGPVVADALAQAAGDLAAQSGIDRAFEGPLGLVILEDDLGELTTANGEQPGFAQVTLTLEQGVVVLAGTVENEAAALAAMMRVEDRLTEFGVDRLIETNLVLLSDLLEERLADEGISDATVVIGTDGGTVFIPPGQGQGDQGPDAIVGSELEALGFDDSELAIFIGDPADAIAAGLTEQGFVVAPSQVAFVGDEIVSLEVCQAEPEVEAAIRDAALATVRTLGFDQTFVIEFSYCDLALTGSATRLLIVVGAAAMAAGSMLVQFASVDRRNVGRRRTDDISIPTIGATDHRPRRRRRQRCSRRFR